MTHEITDKYVFYKQQWFSDDVIEYIIWDILETLNKWPKHRHHVIPISMDWHDIDENTYMTPEKEHRLIHNILSIPYRIIRLFRMKTNHMVHRWEEYQKELMKVHKNYFSKSKFSRLPYHIRCSHISSLQKQINKLSNELWLISQLPKNITDHSDYILECITIYNNLLAMR
jgi:hypothetical protein